jgi:hypothetical protein
MRCQQFGAMKMALLFNNSMLVVRGYRRSHLTTVDASILSRGIVQGIATLPVSITSWNPIGRASLVGLKALS